MHTHKHTHIHTHTHTHTHAHTYTHATLGHGRACRAWLILQEVPTRMSLVVLETRMENNGCMKFNLISGHTSALDLLATQARDPQALANTPKCNFPTPYAFCLVPP